MTALRGVLWQAVPLAAVILGACLAGSGCGGLAVGRAALGPVEGGPSPSALSAPRGVIGQVAPPAPAPPGAAPAPYQAPLPYNAPTPSSAYPPGQWNPHGAYAPYAQPGAATYPQVPGVETEPKPRFQSVEAMVVGFVSLGLAVLCGFSIAIGYAEGRSGSSQAIGEVAPAFGVGAAAFTLLGGTLVLYGVQTPD